MIRCFEHHSSFFVLYIRCFDVAFGWKLSSHCLKEIFCQISTNFKQILSFSSNKLYYFLWSNIVIFFEQISFISNTHYHFFKRGVIFSSQDYFTFGENIIWNLWQAFGESFPHLDFPSQKVCDINGTVYHDWISRIKGGKESGSFFQSANCKKCYFCSLSWSDIMTRRKWSWGQLNRWPCHSDTFWFLLLALQLLQWLHTMTTMNTVIAMTTKTTMTTMTNFF